MKVYIYVHVINKQTATKCVLRRLLNSVCLRINTVYKVLTTLTVHIIVVSDVVINIICVWVWLRSMDWLLIMPTINQGNTIVLLTCIHVLRFIIYFRNQMMGIRSRAVIFLICFTWQHNWRHDTEKWGNIG